MVTHGLEQRDDGLWICPRCSLPPLQRPARHKCASWGGAAQFPPLLPGDVFHQMLRDWLGQDIRKGCGCAEMIRKMNEWGWSGCHGHAGEIAEKMVEEGVRRNMAIAKLPGAKWAAKAVVCAVLVYGEHKAAQSAE